LVPDVAGDADRATGYKLVVHGDDSVVVGGTSAVAPLYAGLFAACGTKLGFDQPTIRSTSSFDFAPSYGIIGLAIALEDRSASRFTRRTEHALASIDYSCFRADA
jgi:hypothetical protein